MYLPADRPIVGAMRGSSERDEELVSKHATKIVGQMETNLDDIVRAVQSILTNEFAEIGGHGDLLELLYDAVRGNLDAYIPAIRHRIPVELVRPPTPALEHARRMAQRGVPSNILVRGYRLGHQALLDQIVNEIHESGLEAQLGLDVFQLLSTASFSYIDRIMEEVLASHGRERDRWLTNKNRIRAVRVHEALEATGIDIDQLTRTVGYPFGLTHLGFVLWYDETETGNELEALERFAVQLGAAVDSRHPPLFVAADGATAWVWLALTTDNVADGIERARAFVQRQLDAPRVVSGTPAPGPEGFRQSHRQALDTKTAMLASQTKSGDFTCASDRGVEIVIRFCRDLESTRRWVAVVLGGLASATDSDERLRETVRKFLSTGSSLKTTADEQHLHVNSVKYRLQRAAERRGRDLGDGRLDLEVALLLTHWFGRTVLS